MKYIYVKKKDGTLKYKELKDKPLSSKHILNIEVSDDFVFPKGSDIILRLNKDLTQKEIGNKELIRSSGFGRFIANTSETQVLINTHNEEINNQLKKLDKLIPRALEDVIQTLNKDNTFDSNINDIISEKINLRRQLE